VPLPEPNLVSVERISEILLSSALLVLLVFTSAFPQNQPLYFNHLTVDNGLSQNSVYAILEDRYGFLWFGTADGLNKYDGYGFTVYKSYARDSTTLSNNTIRTLCEDHKGMIWIGTDGGLNAYDPLTCRFRRFTNDERFPLLVRTGCLEAVCCDSHDNLWIETGNGVVLYDSSRTRVRVFPFADSARSPRAYLAMHGLIADRRGRTWVGTSDGLMRYDNNTGKLCKGFRLPVPLSLNRGGAVFPVCEDTTDGSLWLCVERFGLLHTNPTEGTTLAYRFGADQRSLVRDKITSVGRDRFGRILIGSFEGGLFVFDTLTHTFAQYKNDQADPYSLSFNIVRSILLDRAGILWVGTDGAGVNIADSHVNQFVRVRHDPQRANTLGGNFLKSIFQDRHGTLWVGTLGHGLSSFDPQTGRWKNYLHLAGDKYSLAINTVFAVREDTRGTLWLGTDSCLMTLDRRSGRFTRVPLDPRPGSPSPHINTIFVDSSGVIWVGTTGEVYVIDPGTRRAERLAAAKKVPVNFTAWGALWFCEGTDGRIWIATGTLGVFAYDRRTKTLREYKRNESDPSSLSNDAVRCVYCDGTGILWLGTEEGLNRLDPSTGKCRAFTERDGLASNFIYGILPDRDGSLWISTNNGISKFTEKNPPGTQFRNFGTSDGLQAKEFNTGAFWENGRDTLYFGGVNGFNMFHPSAIGTNLHPPSVVVTEVRTSDGVLTAGGPVEAEHNIRVPYGTTEIVINFVGLDYVQPLANRYRYMMEGEDRTWIEGGTQRFARYTNLKPGEYRFRVTACNNDGVWNPTGAAIKLTIVPPFWMTSWFLAVALIGVVSGIGGSIRYFEVRKLRRKMEVLEARHALDRERERISQDMHDEVGSTLTRIAILGELAVRNVRRPDETKVQLEKISEMSRLVIDSLGEIVWALNPKNDTLDNLLAYTRQYVGEYLEMTTMRCALEFPDTVEPVPLSAEYRRNIFLTVKEAVHNVVRHAGATEVKIRCVVEGALLSVSVTDNGRGFLPPAPGHMGNGVTNMKKRVEGIGGKLTIGSAPGNGTEVSFRIELPREEPELHRLPE